MTNRPLICFDWDGTLADSMDLCIQECRVALLAMGLPDLPDETLMKCNGPTDWDACGILGVPDDWRTEFVRIRANAGMELTPAVNKLFEGVKEMLLHLSTVAELAIVSNGQSPYIDLCVECFGLKGIFTAKRAFTEGYTKADLLQNLLDEKKPARAIMVGDRAGDINAGKACKLQTVAACYGYGNEQEYALADVRCDTVHDLEQWLLQWVQD